MLPKNTVIDGVYQIIGRIGSGGSGDIYLAIHLRLQKYVVLKHFLLNASDLNFIRNEADVLKELHHPALPQVYDFIQVGSEIYTVIDHVDGVDFERLMTGGQRFEEQQLAQYMLETSQVLEYLHGKGILHSDIKPGNIMLRNDGTICLIDFNISILCGGEIPLNGFSVFYSSPEQLLMGMEYKNRQPITAVLDARSDIYSLGATFYFLMTGIRPNEDGQGVIPLSELAPDYSPEFIRIVSRAMEPDPADRYPSARELTIALKRHLRRGSDFRRRCIMHAAIIGLCGTILCAGIWCLVFGLGEKRHESFLQAYRQVQTAAEDGRYQDVISGGVDLLNTYADQSGKNRQSWIEVLMAVADGSVQLADQTDSVTDQQHYLEQAADYYEDAAIFSAENSAPQAEECMVNWGCLLIRLNRAYRLSQPPFPVTDEQDKVLKAMYLAGTGDSEGAQSALDTLPQHLRYSIYLALASQRETQSDQTGAIRYLELAYEQSASPEVGRQLAQAYMRSGAEHADAESYRLAQSIYARICQDPFASLTDSLNYAASARAAGDLQTAKQVIDELLLTHPQHADVLTQAALIYDQLGEKQTARSYAAAALDTQSIDAKTTQVLQEIAD